MDFDFFWEAFRLWQIWSDVRMAKLSWVWKEQTLYQKNKYLLVTNRKSFTLFQWQRNKSNKSQTNILRGWKVFSLFYCHWFFQHLFDTHYPFPYADPRGKGVVKHLQMKSHPSHGENIIFGGGREGIENFMIRWKRNFNQLDPFPQDEKKGHLRSFQLIYSLIFFCKNCK